MFLLFTPLKAILLMLKAVEVLIYIKKFLCTVKKQN